MMKTLKTHIIKLLAIVIGVIYLLMPIHKEVKRVLHSMSHSIEKSSFMLHHDHTHSGHVHLKEEPTEAAVPHHEHDIIKILDYFAEANDHHKESKNQKTWDVEFDKHFHSSKYRITELASIDNSMAIDAYTENFKDHFYSKIKVPPKAAV